MTDFPRFNENYGFVSLKWQSGYEDFCYTRRSWILHTQSFISWSIS